MPLIADTGCLSSDLIPGSRSRPTLVQVSYPGEKLAPAHRFAMSWRSSPRRAKRDVVEVNGIEPSTSCLQSRRSPN